MRCLTSISLVFLLLFQGGCAAKRVDSGAPDDGDGAPEAVEKGEVSGEDVTALPGDGPWSAKEYEQFRVYLLTHPDKLYPRIGDPDTEAAFYRFIDIPILADLPSPEASIDEKLGHNLRILSTVKDVFQTYFGVWMNTQSLYTELCHLFGALLNASSQQVGMAEEVLSQFSPEDPSYEVRMAGLSKMKDGSYNLLAGFLTAFGERDTQSPEDRLILATAFRDHAAPLMAFLKEGHRKEIETMLSRLYESETDAQVKAALDGYFGA